MTDRDDTGNIRHSDGTINVAEADKLLEAIRSIMEKHHLNFGPAVDFYIKQRIKEGK